MNIEVQNPYITGVFLLFVHLYPNREDVSQVNDGSPHQVFKRVKYWSALAEYAWPTTGRAYLHLGCLLFFYYFCIKGILKVHKSDVNCNTNKSTVILHYFRLLYKELSPRLGTNLICKIKPKSPSRYAPIIPLQLMILGRLTWFFYKMQVK